MIAYSVGHALAASLIVWAVGLCLFGFQLSQWPEWQGRVIGIAGTMAGVTGAAVGLKIALRARQQRVK